MNIKIKNTIIISLIIFCSLSPLIGCSQDTADIKEKVDEVFSVSPVSVEEIVLCKNVGSNSSPIEPTNHFPTGTSSICLSIKVKNFTAEDMLSISWNFLETGKEIDRTDFTSDKPGSGYFGFNIKTSGEFPSGKYNVEVTLNNKPVETIEFFVE